MKVYLSGGFVTGWQDEVMEKVPEADFYNPMDFELPGATVRLIPAGIYAPMDMAQIKMADVVFGYLEASNPTPINIIAECMYALGLGKTVILCSEWTHDNQRNKSLRAIQFKDDDGRTWWKPHYMYLVENWVNFYETDFGRAIDLLKAMTDAD